MPHSPLLTGTVGLAIGMVLTLSLHPTVVLLFIATTGVSGYLIMRSLTDWSSFDGQITLRLIFALPFGTAAGAIAMLDLAHKETQTGRLPLPLDESFPHYYMALFFLSGLMLGFLIAGYVRFSPHWKKSWQRLKALREQEEAQKKAQEKILPKAPQKPMPRLREMFPLSIFTAIILLIGVVFTLIMPDVMALSVIFMAVLGIMRIIGGTWHPVVFGNYLLAIAAASLTGCIAHIWGLDFTLTGLEKGGTSEYYERLFHMGLLVFSALVTLAVIFRPWQR